MTKIIKSGKTFNFRTQLTGQKKNSIKTIGHQESRIQYTCSCTHIVFPFIVLCNHFFPQITKMVRLCKRT